MDLLISNLQREAAHTGASPEEEEERKLHALEALIFPNMSSMYDDLGVSLRHLRRPGDPQQRSLADDSKCLGTAGTQVMCVTCRGMKYCGALDGYMVEEVYLPDNPDALGTCKAIDQLGNRVQEKVFGRGATFRNSYQCRDLVMQYLCLFWGSDNSQYSNGCASVDCEDVSSSIPANHKLAPRPPCRSFCVVVATTCTNDPTFVKLCAKIECPPTSDQCLADPTLQRTKIVSNLGCNLPTSTSPYILKNGATQGCLPHSPAVLLFLLLVSLLICKYM